MVLEYSRKPLYGYPHPRDIKFWNPQSHYDDKWTMELPLYSPMERILCCPFVIVMALWMKVQEVSKWCVHQLTLSLIRTDLNLSKWFYLDVLGILTPSLYMETEQSTKHPYLDTSTRTPQLAHVNVSSSTLLLLILHIR
jgi:hypothetical protein